MEATSSAVTVLRWRTAPAFLLAFALAVLTAAAPAQAPAAGDKPAAPPLLRSGQIERIAPLPSAFVAPREVQVWLPPLYAVQQTRRYRVLYLHDGQNLFDTSAVGTEWSVDETAQRLVLAGAIDPVIIVAVSNTPDRISEYTPWPGRFRGALMGGDGPAYARYLIEELKPLIDSRFRTQRDAAATAVGGSSLGGLVSMWLLLQHPQVFGSALVVSPSVWWSDEAILKAVADAPPPTGAAPPPRIWLDIGLREGDEAVNGARDLRDALRARGWPVQYSEWPDAPHHEAAWAARVEPMLKFLYPAHTAQPANAAAPPIRVRAVAGTAPAAAGPAPAAAVPGASAPP